MNKRTVMSGVLLACVVLSPGLAARDGVHKLEFSLSGNTFSGSPKVFLRGRGGNTPCSTAAISSDNISSSRVTITVSEGIVNIDEKISKAGRPSPQQGARRSVSREGNRFVLWFDGDGGLKFIGSGASDTKDSDKSGNDPITPPSTSTIIEFSSFEKVNGQPWTPPDSNCDGFPSGFQEKDVKEVVYDGGYTMFDFPEDIEAVANPLVIGYCKIVVGTTTYYYRCR